MSTLSVNEVLQTLADNDAVHDTNFLNGQKWTFAALWLALAHEARHWRAQLRVQYPTVDDDRRLRAAARLAARMVTAQLKSAGSAVGDELEAEFVKRAMFQLDLDEQVDPTADLF
ncbi:MAG: hypothetical protein KA201_03420 [Kofleriaceae bacterium]|nr:hypothetical protein [Kofleriaceae bacterium]